MEKKKSYNFGEKEQEFYKGSNVPVWRSPKYEQSREAAIKILESEEFGAYLSEADFWIQMNATKSGKMAYTGLIISHDALLRINQHLPEENRFHERFCSSPKPFEYDGHKGMMMEYRDERDGMYEVGEITTETCQNSYYFAMLLKRTFDRVVKRKANLTGIYSDSEADEFSEKLEEGAGKDATPATEIKCVSSTKKPMEEKPVSKPDAANITADDLSPFIEAGSHVLEYGNNWKGKKLSELILSDQSPESKEKLLSIYATRGSESDRKACQIALDALKRGLYVMPGTVQAV